VRHAERLDRPHLLELEVRPLELLEKARAPTPGGSCLLWLGPATKPSRDIVVVNLNFVTAAESCRLCFGVRLDRRLRLGRGLAARAQW
jgi:hypothetical protein